MYATGGMGKGGLRVICGSKDVGRRLQSNIGYAILKVVVGEVAMLLIKTGISWLCEKLKGVCLLSLYKEWGHM